MTVIIIMVVISSHDQYFLTDGSAKGAMMIVCITIAVMISIIIASLALPSGSNVSSETYM